MSDGNAWAQNKLNYIVLKIEHEELIPLDIGLGDVIHNISNCVTYSFPRYLKNSQSWVNFETLDIVVIK
jgi:hypothetical protein